MRQPSKISLVVAGEILDHVNYGLARPDIIREWAEVIDEHNVSLLEAACDVIDSAETNHGVPDARYVQKLRAVLAEYQPQPGMNAAKAANRSSSRSISRLAK
jgi:hypothetical protein